MGYTPTSTTKNIPLMYRALDFLKQVYDIQHKQKDWVELTNAALSQVEASLAQMGRTQNAFPRIES